MTSTDHACQDGFTTLVIAVGDTITMPEPEREGYTFDYWAGSTYYAGDEYTVKGDHTFTAKWKQVEEEEPEPVDTDDDKDDEGDPSKPATGDDAPYEAFVVFAAALAALIVVMRRHKVNR